MNPIPVILACAGTVALISANFPGNTDHILPARRVSSPRPAEKRDGLIFSRALVLMDLSACEGKTVEFVSRIPGIGEAILLDIMDAAASAGLLWLTTQHRLKSPGFNAKMRLVAHKNYLESLGTPARVLLELTGDKDRTGTLLGVASREDAALVVMRSEPASRFLSTFLESTATRALRRCTQRDMLLYPASAAEKAAESLAIPPPRDMFRKILCPTDLSSLGIDAIAWASGLDEVREIVLLHVLPAKRTPRESVERDNALHALEELRQLITLPDLSVTTLIREGDPAREIERVAEEQEVSLILMPRCGMSRYLRGCELGTTIAAVANRLNRPLLARRPAASPKIRVLELAVDEFSRAEELWTRYRHQKADRTSDRIFGMNLDNQLVSVAWCKRHRDGLEVDGVFTLEEFRRNGFARRAVTALVAACGNEPLYMHATLELVEFYRSMGFVPIPEDDLPLTIRERFAFALGNLEGANACPMRRLPAAEDPPGEIPANT